MKNFLILTFFLAVSVAGCRNKTTKPDTGAAIRLQPFVGMDSNRVRLLAKEIAMLYPTVVISQPVELPLFAYYKPRDRFKADSLLKFLRKSAAPGEIILGLTESDISTGSTGLEDWGVMGLGSCPGLSCVVSTYRLSKSKVNLQLFKVAIHELGHNFGLPHCSDKQCYMRDAKGGNPTDEERYFCQKCRLYLNRFKWTISEAIVRK